MISSSKEIVLPIPIEFEWDIGNIYKNYFKHNVTLYEAEEVFQDISKIVYSDLIHSESEDRFILVGQTKVGRGLCIVYVVSNGKIRVISARDLNKKEKIKYEKTS